MKVTYDQEADALYIAFNQDGEISFTDEFKENLLIDYDDKSKMLGIEISEARKTLGHDILKSLISSL